MTRVARSLTNVRQWERPIGRWGKPWSSVVIERAEHSSTQTVGNVVLDDDVQPVCGVLISIDEPEISHVPTASC
jgi:hypothetical protein